MIEIVYLSKKDRERLSQINQHIGVLTPEMIKEKADIEARRKGLSQMSIRESQDMIIEINEKIYKMQSIGKATPGFSAMLQQLYQHIDTLARQQAKVQQQVNAETIRKDAALEKSRKHNPLSRPVRSKWSTRTGVGVSNDPKDRTS